MVRRDVSFGFNHPALGLAYKVRCVLYWLLYPVGSIHQGFTLGCHLQISVREPELGHQLIGVLLVGEIYVRSSQCIIAILLYCALEFP